MAFKQAKLDLHKLLTLLNDKLNHRLHSASSPNMNYDEWLLSHKPFNWLAEFYQIIEGNGGFDVIIGNPPYVVYKDGGLDYQITGYYSKECGNLYAFCLERSKILLHTNGRLSMIVPVAIVNGSKFKSIRNLFKGELSHISNYCGDTHPGVLFTGVQQNLSIIFIEKGRSAETYLTDYIRFFNSSRGELFTTLRYEQSDETENGFFKLSRAIQKRILVHIKGNKISYYYSTNKDRYIYKKTTSGSQYKLFFKAPPFFEIDGVIQIASSFKPIFFNQNIDEWCALALYNSNLFNLWWVSLSDGRNVTGKETDSIMLPNSVLMDSVLSSISRKLMIDLENKSTIVTYNKAKGITRYAQFVPRLSKSVIDEIDTVLARHYGFTDEELDFIINYDIKYRMGDELNNSEE